MSQKFYATVSYIAEGAEGEADLSASSVQELLLLVGNVIKLDLGSTQPNVLTIHIHKDSVDGED